MVTLEPPDMLGLRQPPAMWMILPAKHLKGGVYRDAGYAYSCLQRQGGHREMFLKALNEAYVGKLPRCAGV